MASSPGTWQSCLSSKPGLVHPQRGWCVMGYSVRHETTNLCSGTVEKGARTSGSRAALQRCLRDASLPDPSGERPRRVSPEDSPKPRVRLANGQERHSRLQREGPGRPDPWLVSPKSRTRRLRQEECRGTQADAPLLSEGVRARVEPLDFGDGRRCRLRGGTHHRARLRGDHPSHLVAPPSCEVDAGEAVDHLSRPLVRKKKRRRDRLMEVAGADPKWAVGFEDECWWSRFALPTLNAWAEEGKPPRLIQRSVAKDDPEPKAISCYGLYLPEIDETWIRFVDGRPVSSITTRFLSWSLEKLEEIGKKFLVLIWDNASWHVSKEVRRWLGKHNRRVKESGCGVRIVGCLLPKQSPWLNSIEPKWVHAKRKVIEPDGLLGAYELAGRVCGVFGCPHYEHLTVPQKVV